MICTAGCESECVAQLITIVVSSVMLGLALTYIIYLKGKIKENTKKHKSFVVIDEEK